MVAVASPVRARWRACLLAVLVVVPLQAVLPTTVAEATAPAPPAVFRFRGASASPAALLG
jgi:hypothetical protein